jgi:ubiquinone/menaquinone biosynthesis C-methylase UbiE
MIGKIEKEKVIRDFQQKQKTYYENNYQIENEGNYLRRLRRNLILGELNTAQKFDNVLDIGCGPAILYPDLLDHCSQYYALDLAESNLEEIKRNNSNKKITCLLGDLDEFKWDENYFDIIICAGVLEYTDYPEENLLKVQRLLKKGGILVCSFPNILSPYRLWGEYVYKYLSKIRTYLIGKEINYYPRRLFGVGKLDNVLRDLGLQKIDVKYFGYKFIVQPFDILCRNVDYRILRYFEENPKEFLQKLCSEILLIVKK